MIIYLIIVNFISFIIYGVDKFLSIKHYYRISEFILLSFSFIGGVVGSMLGMIVFKHKTKKIKFKIYLFIYFVMWLFCLICYLDNVGY